MRGKDAPVLCRFVLPFSSVPLGDMMPATTKAPIKRSRLALFFVPGNAVLGAEHYRLINALLSVLDMLYYFNVSCIVVLEHLSTDFHTPHAERTCPNINIWFPHFVFYRVY